MRLPNAQQAGVERGKIIDYLLNPAHPDNAGKAPFFLALGFGRDEWQSLAGALVRMAETTEVAKCMESPHGRKYVLDGRLETPSGRSPFVRTVWIIDSGSAQPRLVTAYPRPE